MGRSLGGFGPFLLGGAVSSDVADASGCARAAPCPPQIWVGYDGCGTDQAYRVVMRHRSVSFFDPLVTEPCNQSYKGGLGCSYVDALRWGVVEVVGSTDEERRKTFGERTAASEFD